MYWEGQTILKALENSSINSFFSFLLIVLSSAIIPDFAPPNGRPAREHFQVIALANLETSSIETDGVILMPPFPGPRAKESITTKPLIPDLGWYTSRIFSGPISSKSIINITS